MIKPDFAYARTKALISFAVTLKLISAIVFRYTDSTIPHLHTAKISSFQHSFVTVQAGLCGTWLVTPKTGFLVLRLKCCLLFTDTLFSDYRLHSV